jgi:hypothetical protein
MLYLFFITMLNKALETNSTQEFKDYASEPNFNPHHIGKRIDELNLEIDYLRRNAWSQNGTDAIILKSKIAIRDSLICNLKSIKLLNHE